MLHLAKAFTEAGYQVDLLLCHPKGAFLDAVPENINVVALKPSSSLGSRFRILLANPTLVFTLLLPILLPHKPPKTVRFISDLTHYLLREQPDALLSAKTHANLVAIWSRKIAAGRTRVVISERSTMSTVIKNASKWRWRFMKPLLRKVYPQADLIVTVSRGVAEDISSYIGIPQDRMTTIYNPMLTEHIKTQSSFPVSHPWLNNEEIPVILGVGRLVPAKDFPTLLRAFALLRAQRPARLVILGEGRERAMLEKLGMELGIDSDLSLPGFTDNPYAFMSKATVFVLSSKLEGLPNALIEALACGCPVVSTNCRSGPDEILDNGAFGTLVPVRDANALAEAILQTVEHPQDADRLRARASEFDINTIAKRYLKALFPV